MTDRELVREAIEAKKNAYVPYSKFPVGAALLTKEGKVYRGCNIECASYGGTNCAERTAIFKAVSEGDRNIEAIAVVSDLDDYTYPCGICRQVIVEYGRDIKLIIGKSEEEFKVYTINDLLPNSFTPEDLEKKEAVKNNDI
ncbi:cytidine deaminase [Alkaliphilus oremlandii]|uniref:Cytidine deaminase n=1 Tax=Alkaliphilus oremlandii (strain OhILAs) TaxID=350688 RepID=A8MG69_ALKOO|nr:cytidine deaminase [Alkaliphilus oremlandii]ABW18797.1 cytidine deaminase [Alkaliphilus oremlandii OhILAs]